MERTTRHLAGLLAVGAAFTFVACAPGSGPAGDVGLDLDGGGNPAGPSATTRSAIDALTARRSPTARPPISGRPSTTLVSTTTVSTTAVSTTTPQPSSTTVPAPTSTPTTAAAPPPAPAVTTAPAPAPETTSPPPPPPPPPPAPVASGGSTSSQAIELANQQRAAAGLPALASSGVLNGAAAQHSADQAGRDRMGHDGSDGSSVGDRVAANGGGFSTWGENVAYGYGSASAVIDGWMGSSGHRANMLNPAFTQVGVAYAESAGGTLYWTMVLGG